MKEPEGNVNPRIVPEGMGWWLLGYFLLSSTAILGLFIAILMAAEGWL